MLPRNRIGKFSGKIYKHFGTPTLLVLLTAAFLMQIYNGLEFHERLGQSRAAESDIRVWSIAQSEVDHTNLLLKINELRSPQVKAGSREAPIEDMESWISEISVTFDIFFSRLEVVSTILDKPGVPQDIRANVKALIESRDQLAGMLDQSDLYNPAQMLAFKDAVIALEDPMRSLVLEALSYFVAEAETAREQELESSQWFFAGSFVLLIMMALAIWISLLQHRRMKRQVSVIKNQNANIRLVYEASLVAVIVTNSGGEIQLLNSAAKQTFGFEAAEADGQNVADIMIPTRHLDRFERGMKRYQDTGKGCIINRGAKQTTLLRQDGTEFPAELSIRSETDAEGEEIFIAFVRDISEQLAFEKNLREARDEAQRLAAAKTMFLATMSHEMRTPLHGLLASLDLVETGDMDEAARDLIETARNCGLQTLQQINDVLELTQIGEIEEPLTPFSPRETVSKILDELRPLAKDHRNQLILNVTNPAVDTKWLGFPKKFVRAMYNLVGNALKFTQDGKVTVDLDFCMQTVETPRLRVSVKDTGIGISDEDQANLFDLFYVADAGQMGVQANSSGLGLPIVQAAINKMGGTLNVESQLGVGSTFSFEIPLNYLEGSQSLPLQDHPVTPQLYPGLQCLVVDDNRVNLDLTAKMLRRLGCDATTSDSGEAAVARMAKQHFDVVLLDINMPGGISGVETAKRIREHEAGRASSKPAMILALTADTTVSTSTASQGQFDEVLHKPVQKNDLKKMLGRLLSGKTAGMVPFDSSLETTPKASPSDFTDLFELLGEEHGARLLDGVLDDIDAAVGAIRLQQADAAFHIHRAIGSTAAVGLLEFSQQLRQAEDLARSNDMSALSGVLASIESGAHHAQKCIRQAQDSIREVDTP